MKVKMKVAKVELSTIAILPLSLNTGEMWLGNGNRSGSWSYADENRVSVCLTRRLPSGGIRKEMAIDGSAATVGDAKEILRAWIEDDLIPEIFTEIARRYLR